MTYPDPLPLPKWTVKDGQWVIEPYILTREEIA